MILQSDFFVYDILSNRWTMITDDTLAMGGPSLIFDHQMCIDQETRTIFVFGGQTVLGMETSPGSSQDKKFSGLYEYHIPTNTWKKRRDDCRDEKKSDQFENELKSRTSHSMLFHQVCQQIFYHIVQFEIF